MLISSDVGSGSRLDDLGLAAWMILCTSPSLVAARSVMGWDIRLISVPVSLLLMFVSEKSIAVPIFIIYLQTKSRHW